MKVLNLRCAQDHRFEGWFSSDDDFSAQCERSLIACPLCDDKVIHRLPSAPRLNVATKRGDDEPPPSAGDIAQARAQGQLLRAMRQLVDNTEDVGRRFPEEARKIHYGETPERGIRGQASLEDAKALHDEGIEIIAIPSIAPLKGTVQ